MSHIRVPARAGRWSGKNNPTFAREPFDDGSSLTNNDWFADAGDNMVDSGNGNDVIFIKLNTRICPSRGAAVVPAHTQLATEISHG